ncbi:hypothetical protein, partial [Cereibacter johrii]
RPAKAGGFKAREDRPAKLRAEGAAERPARAGFKKDFGKKDAPRKPRAEASDTSRRFTPPKKPRS